MIDMAQVGYSKKVMEHCSNLAANALREAIKDYERKKEKNVDEKNGA